MRRLILSAVAVSALGLSALALPAVAAPAAAVAVAQDPITEAEVEARAAAFEVTLEALVVEIEAIRADTSLSEEERQARMQAAIDRKQPEIDGFIAMLSGFVRQQTLEEGGTAEDAELAAGMIEDMFNEMLVPGLLSGEIAAGMAGEGE
ncbi:MAG: hypothetical protein KKF88_06605 [Alphaproteobacteria bacterium]|nr:hypothetical protein [Alphaproteobacteria bacterium]